MSKIYDGIMGLVVGDALGVPFEFRERDTFKATGMTGYGTYKQPPGTWSDDSSMTLATLESLVRCKKIDLDDIMDNFCRWYVKGDFTPYGETFDIGRTTEKAIGKYYGGNILGYKTNAINCGCGDISDNGNGSLMRILPLAFIRHYTEDVFNVSALTHSHEISKVACMIYDDIAQSLMYKTKEYAVWLAQRLTNLPEFARIGHIGELSRSDIKSTGYVVDTLEAALWCLMTTDNYRDCVLTAVNLGDDTDTVAAVAGGLAGIYYGVGGKTGIPEEWIAQIAKKDYIKALCDRFEKRWEI